ncbi:MAG: primosomal protein N', partial [Acidobacteriota bacterium]
MSALFADVAVPLPLFQTFTYSVPDSLGDELHPGCRVLVPFGTRHLVGLVTQVHRESREGTVKPILETLDRKPILSPSLLKLGL